MKERRNTIQLSIVSDTVNRLKCHASADDVYAQIVLTHPNISRATVYRNLNRLADCGHIKKIEVPDAADRFDHNVSDHYHARCVKCGKVYDVDMEPIKDLQKSIKHTNGFEYTGHDIMFKGICADCNKNNR